MHSIHDKILPKFYFNFTKVENTHQHSTRFATSFNYNQIKHRTEKVKRTLPFIGRAWYGMERKTIFPCSILEIFFHSISILKIFHSILKFSSIFHSILPHQRNFSLEAMQCIFSCFAPLQCCGVPL